MNVKDMLSTNSELLAAPQVACKLTRLLKTSPFNEDVISVVQYDPALTARILQVCNTVVFGRWERISSLEEALLRMGYENVLRIVWQLNMGDKMCAPLPVYGMEIGMLWRHSITAAIAAEELWELTEVIEEDQPTAFTAGLLHDLGKIMINLTMLHNPGILMHHAQTNGLSMLQAEKALFGVDHAELGGELLKQWGQTDALISAVANHHVPESAASTPLAYLVHLADVCTHAMGASYGWGAMSVPLRDEAMDGLGIKPEDLEKVMLEMRTRSEEIEIFMSIL